MTRFDALRSQRESLFLQAALFATAHLSPGLVVTHSTIGVVLGMFRRSSRSLWPGIAAHAAWNAVVLAMGG